MLVEIFLLRWELLLRASKEAPLPRAPRFVPMPVSAFSHCKNF